MVSDPASLLPNPVRRALGPFLGSRALDHPRYVIVYKADWEATRLRLLPLRSLSFLSPSFFLRKVAHSCRPSQSWQYIHNRAAGEGSGLCVIRSLLLGVGISSADYRPTYLIGDAV